PAWLVASRMKYPSTSRISGSGPSMFSSCSTGISFSPNCSCCSRDSRTSLTRRFPLDPKQTYREVNLDRLRPVVHVDVEERLCLLDARVIHEHVDLPELLLDLIHERAHRARV